LWAELISITPADAAGNTSQAPGLGSRSSALREQTADNNTRYKMKAMTGTVEMQSGMTMAWNRTLLDGLTRTRRTPRRCHHPTPMAGGSGMAKTQPRTCAATFYHHEPCSPSPAHIKRFSSNTDHNSHLHPISPTCNAVFCKNLRRFLTSPMVWIQQYYNSIKQVWQHLQVPKCYVASGQRDFCSIPG